jgi:hypothetical protein
MFGGSGFSVVSFASAPGFIYTAAVAETSNATEQNIANVSLLSSVSETSSVSQQVSASVGFVGRVDESCIGTDTFIAGAISNITVAESSNAQDQVFSTFSITLNIFERADIAETRDVGGGYSSGAFASGSYDGLGDESRRVSGDSIFCALGAIASVVDGAGAADVVIRQIIVPRTVLEDALGSELVSALPVYGVTVDEVVQAQDTVDSPITSVGAKVSENTQAIDAIFTNADVTFGVFEGVTANDQNFTTASLAVSMSQGAEARDKNFLSVSVVSNVQEGVLAAEQCFARFLWEPINTSEDADWVVINSSAAPASQWAVGDNTQATDWELVDTVN